MPEVTNGIFSNFCYDKMWDLFRNHDNEIGSNYDGNKAGHSITNCVIYVMKVLMYGNEKIGYSNTVNEIKKMYKRQDGIELAKFLTTRLG